MQLHQTQNDFVRSVYEGIAYNSKKQMQTLESFVKKSSNEINFIGAGAESDLWCQIHADIFECPIHKVKDPRLASAKGAAWLAFIGLKNITADDIENLVNIERIFHPIQQNAQVYREGFSNFLDINQAQNEIYCS